MMYFEFPIILIDGDFEQSKRERSVTNMDSSVDYAIGSCEVFGDATLVRITDSWLPTEEHFLEAIGNDFTACTVAFDGIGTFEVPMTKKEFKKLYRDFLKRQEKEKPKMEIIHLNSKEDLEKILNKLNQQNEQSTEEESPSGPIGGI